MINVSPKNWKMPQSEERRLPSSILRRRLRSTSPPPSGHMRAALPDAESGPAPFGCAPSVLADAGSCSSAPLGAVAPRASGEAAPEAEAASDAKATARRTKIAAGEDAQLWSDRRGSGVPADQEKRAVRAICTKLSLNMVPLL